MRKLRQWLRERFLPAWAEASLVEENKILLARLAALEHRHSELKHYVRGIERALRAGRTKIITTGGGAHGCTDAGAR